MIFPFAAVPPEGERIYDYELPQGKDYVVEVRARNCYGKASCPLVGAKQCRQNRK